MKAIKRLEAEMYRHARNLEFEEAARIRDQIERLRQATFGVDLRAGRLTTPRRSIPVGVGFVYRSPPDRGRVAQR